jgi:GTP-binding nuclear protein Ran
MSRVLKVVIVGDGGVGKSTLINRFHTGEFEKRYIATMGVDVRPITLEMDEGPVTFNVWDCAGQEKFQGGFDGYCAGARFAIIMFDVTNRASYKNCEEWIAKLPKDLPFVVCGNKVDCKERKVKPDDIFVHRRHNAKYFDISAKSNYNYDAPFKFIANATL